MNVFDLRPARTTDAGRVAEILSAFIDETPWMPRIHTRAEHLSFAAQMIDRGWVTVAEGAAGIAGFAARDGAEVHALYVEASLRGTGCGSALMRQMKAHATALSLWTCQVNARARAFYRAHRFSEVGRSDGAGNDAGLPDIRMAWQRRS